MSLSGDNPIVLLDDPLSAVDSRCANHIFNKLVLNGNSGVSIANTI